MVEPNLRKWAGLLFGFFLTGVLYGCGRRSGDLHYLPERIKNAQLTKVSLSFQSGPTCLITNLKLLSQFVEAATQSSTNFEYSPKHTNFFLGGPPSPTLAWIRIDFNQASPWSSAVELFPDALDIGSHVHMFGDPADADPYYFSIGFSKANTAWGKLLQGFVYECTNNFEYVVSLDLKGNPVFREAGK